MMLTVIGYKGYTQGSRLAAIPPRNINRRSQEKSGEPDSWNSTQELKLGNPVAVGKQSTEKLRTSVIAV
jgi:hypothetical protein